MGKVGFKCIDSEYFEENLDPKLMNPIRTYNLLSSFTPFSK